MHLKMYVKIILKILLTVKYYFQLSEVIWKIIVLWLFWSF